MFSDSLFSYLFCLSHDNENNTNQVIHSMQKEIQSTFSPKSKLHIGNKSHVVSSFN
jgi:hypothetical protein